MKLFGFQITRLKATTGVTPSQPMSTNWWWPIIREPFTGAFQRNMEIKPETILAYHAVYACVTLIASDIGKLRIQLVENDGDDIWTPVDRNSPYWQILLKQNRYQSRIQFFEQWLISKLLHGNTYVLKDRDERGLVSRLYVLDPMRVKPLIAPDGSVFYELSRRDDLVPQQDAIRVPASEIIHDRMVPLYHPLCGVSPITACGLAAWQGLRIQNNSSEFFGNFSQPGGILTAPGIISDEIANRLKTQFEANFSGINRGRLAVLGDGLKYEAMAVNAVDAQLIEQLKWTAETVCSAFHVPPYMVGIGPPPTYTNIEALNQQYYAQCLQTLIEAIEILLDEGLSLPRIDGRQYGTEFDLVGLLRMDTSTKVKSVHEAITAGFMKPNEARAMFDMKPVEGGDTPYLQDQYYSLAAHKKRDTSDDPFARTTNVDRSEPEEEPEPEPAEDDDEVSRNLANILLKRAHRYGPGEAAA